LYGHYHRATCNGQIAPVGGFHRPLDGGQPFSRVQTRISGQAENRTPGEKCQTAALPSFIEVNGSVPVWPRTEPKRHHCFAEFVNVRQWNRALLVAGRNDESVRE